MKIIYKNIKDIPDGTLVRAVSLNTKFDKKIMTAAPYNPKSAVKDVRAFELYDKKNLNKKLFDWCFLDINHIEFLSEKEIQQIREAQNV